MVRFADALESGDIHVASTIGALQNRLGISHDRLRAYRDVLLAASETKELVLALRVATRTASALATAHPTIEVAWTYPGNARPGLRTTGGVAREIIEASRRSLLLVGYAVAPNPAYSGLAAQTVDAIARAAERGVVVTAVLHHGANKSSLLHGWRLGVSLPSIYTWPVSDDEMASIHAKLLIADRDDALVTSANLTYHGFERNLEMGLHVTGRAAAQMHAKIDELISDGELIPWKD